MALHFTCARASAGACSSTALCIPSSKENLLRGLSSLSCPSLEQHMRQTTFKRSNSKFAAARAGVDVFVVDFEGVIGSKDGTVYPGIAEALSTTKNPFYVVAEEKETASRVLKEEAKVDIPADSPRILSGEGGSVSKKEALKMVASRPVAQLPDSSLHYVEDDAATLQAIADDPEFKSWQLYLATWGDQESQASRDLPARVRQASLKDFPELLKWGLLMGVDDGCQEYEDGRPAA